MSEVKSPSAPTVADILHSQTGTLCSGNKGVSSAVALNMGYRGNVEEVGIGWSSRHRRINQIERSEDSSVKSLFIIINSVMLGFFFFWKNNPLRQQKKMAALSLEHH